MQTAAKARLRRPRTDAARNRDRLIDAAKILFVDGGHGVTLEAVARQAGVGIGTLYRHFPARENLYEAVYSRDIEQMVLFGEREMAAEDPVEGLRRWLHAAIDLAATKKGMIAAFALKPDTTSAISARLSTRLVEAVDPLVRRAVDAGRLPGDLAGEDLLLALVGMCMLRDQAGWQASVVRMVDGLVRGLEMEVRPAADDSGHSKQRRMD